MTKQRLIQLIHIARSDLQMDEDTYRQMLQGLTGKASTKGMDTTQLDRVLESMIGRDIGNEISWGIRANCMITNFHFHHFPPAKYISSRKRHARFLSNSGKPCRY